jgi:hypothetical protein
MRCDQCGKQAENPSSRFTDGLTTFCDAECRDNWLRVNKELREERETNP